MIDSAKPTEEEVKEKEKRKQQGLASLFMQGGSENPMTKGLMGMFNPMYQAMGVPQPGIGQLGASVIGGGIGNILNHRGPDIVNSMKGMFSRNEEM